MKSNSYKTRKYPKLSETVYESIKQRLVDQKEIVKSGAKLNEEQLARNLEVSRTPVREALHKLEKEGLVQIVPRHGAFVRVISVRDVQEIFDIRGALESLAMKFALAHLNREKLLEMESLLKKCGELIKKGNLDLFIQVDKGFHEFIIKSSQNQRLIQIMESLNNQIQLARLKSFSVPGRAKKALNEHKQMIEAMLAGDKIEAERLIRKHSENAKQNILSLMKSSKGKDFKRRKTMSKKKI